MLLILTPRPKASISAQFCSTIISFHTVHTIRTKTSIGWTLKSCYTLNLLPKMTGITNFSQSYYLSVVLKQHNRTPHVSHQQENETSFKTNVHNKD